MDDDTMIERLRDLLPVAEPVPAHVRAAAEAAHGFLTLDAELAELVRDTSGEEVLAGSRGTATARLLTFELGLVEIEVEVEPGPPIAVFGQLIGVAGGRLHLERPQGTIEVAVDDLGRFEQADLASGPCRLHWEGESMSFVTPWFGV